MTHTINKHYPIPVTLQFCYLTKYFYYKFSKFPVLFDFIILTDEFKLSNSLDPTVIIKYSCPWQAIKKVEIVSGWSHVHLII